MSSSLCSEQSVHDPYPVAWAAPFQRLLAGRFWARLFYRVNVNHVAAG